MKKLILMLWLMPGLILAQSKIDKTFGLNGSKKISLNFKYPELIRVHTWDKDEVVIRGTVSINGGQHDDSFTLEAKTEQQELIVTSNIENIDQIPKKTFVKTDGGVRFFNDASWNSPEVQQYIGEHKGEHEYVTHGVHKEITLEVYVPGHVELEVFSKYGLVEVAGISKALTVNAKYGGIDVSFSNSKVGDVTASTKFGEIYTDLDFDFIQQGATSDDHNKWTVITYTQSEGLKVGLESKYGNIYLRK